MAEVEQTIKTDELAGTTLKHGNSYNIFILVLTVMSLAIMGLLLLPLDEDTEQLLRVYDNVICIVFLGDFAMNLLGSHPRRRYFIRQRGWLDLMGSIPSVGGAFRFAGLLRLARLSRLARIAKLMRGEAKKGSSPTSCTTAASTRPSSRCC